MRPIRPIGPICPMVGRAARQGGFAILMVVLVLVGLIIIGAPFAISMRQEEMASVNFAARAHARLAANGALNLAKAQLERSHEFYERYGAKTLVIARFVPIVRTFAPFVAGVGSMKYGRFMTYNVLGAALWAIVCVLAGYFFGNLPLVKKNFSLVILAIIFISILPGVIGVLRERSRARAAS